MSVAQNVMRGITWRFALREMRGGLRGFAVFIACIALGVAAIAGVGSFARSLGDGLAREGRVILGGDVALLDAGASGDPLVRGVHQPLQVGVGQNSFRDIGADSRNGTRPPLEIILGARIVKFRF